MKCSVVLMVVPSGTVMSDTNATRLQLRSIVGDGSGVIVNVVVGVNVFVAV